MIIEFKNTWKYAKSWNNIRVESNETAWWDTEKKEGGITGIIIDKIEKKPDNEEKLLKKLEEGLLKIQDDRKKELMKMKMSELNKIGKDLEKKLKQKGIDIEIRDTKKSELIDEIIEAELKI